MISPCSNLRVMSVLVAFMFEGSEADSQAHSRLEKFVIVNTVQVLALCSDLLSLATSHINFVYTAFAKLYSIEIKALSSLWKLFRGKKQNVLRQRIDSQQFDMDQLLVRCTQCFLVLALFV